MNKRRPKGEGALFTDSRGYWMGEITLPSGRKKRKYSKLQKEVKDWLREQRNAIHAGNWVEKEKVTFGAKRIRGKRGRVAKGKIPVIRILKRNGTV